MSNLPSKAVKKAGRLVVVALLLAFSLRVVDAVGDAKYAARNISCQSSLHQISAAIFVYRGRHHGQMPPSLKSLLPQFWTDSVLLCPMTGFGADGSRHSYAYRFLERPQAGDIICWDSGPHRPCHSVFVWLNGERRNALCADGRVIVVPEARFARLGLRGVILPLPH